MKTKLKLIKLLTISNPYKVFSLVIMLSLYFAILNIATDKKMEVSKYIRLSEDAVYVESGEQFYFIENQNASYKNGYVYYEYYTLHIYMGLLLIIVFIFFLMCTLSSDDDVNFSINKCKASLYIDDIKMISVGSGEYVYLLHKKAIHLSTNPHCGSREMIYSIQKYLEQPNRYYTYISRQEIRGDIINEILNN
jgi:hypothetical protein